jgi:hypothetical protein
MGFATFPASFRVSPEGVPGPSPFPVAQTLRSFSLDCSRTVSLRPGTFSPFHPFSTRTPDALPHRAFLPFPGSRPQGLAPQTSPLLRPALPPKRCSMLPWACSPFSVPTTLPRGSPKRSRLEPALPKEGCSRQDPRRSNSRGRYLRPAAASRAPRVPASPDPWGTGWPYLAGPASASSWWSVAAPSSLESSRSRLLGNLSLDGRSGEPPGASGWGRGRSAEPKLGAVRPPAWRRPACRSGSNLPEQALLRSSKTGAVRDPLPRPNRGRPFQAPSGVVPLARPPPRRSVEVA